MNCWVFHQVEVSSRELLCASTDMEQDHSNVRAGCHVKRDVSCRLDSKLMMVTQTIQRINEHASALMQHCILIQVWYNEMHTAQGNWKWLGSNIKRPHNYGSIFFNILGKNTTTFQAALATGCNNETSSKQTQTHAPNPHPKIHPNSCNRRWQMAMAIKADLQINAIQCAIK